MNVFLSWSGARSKEVAEAFYEWLPTVINSIEPFISQRNIEKGVVGENELSQSLEKINFGIICLTKDNLHSDWILYEAGALSKFQKESRVWTFLLDISPANISPPLSKFQHTNFNEKEVLQLLQSINKAISPDKPLKDDLLKRIFKKNWKELDHTLLAIAAKDADTPEPVRDPSEINRDVLEIVRRQEIITQKIVQQNDDLTRRISQILNQIPRNVNSPLAAFVSPSGGYGVGSLGIITEEQNGLSSQYYLPTNQYTQPNVGPAIPSASPGIIIANPNSASGLIIGNPNASTEIGCLNMPSNNPGNFRTPQKIDQKRQNKKT